ncbi:MAG: hypothetical protein EBZ49_02280 [Proteobacteria bacterium]|nr:hypothetical protein [Pseudomonadota bacterium]
MAVFFSWVDNETTRFSSNPSHREESKNPSKVLVEHFSKKVNSAALLPQAHASSAAISMPAISLRAINYLYKKDREIEVCPISSGIFLDFYSKYPEIIPSGVRIE